MNKRSLPSVSLSSLLPSLSFVLFLSPLVYWFFSPFLYCFGRQTFIFNFFKYCMYIWIHIFDLKSKITQCFYPSPRQCKGFWKTLNVTTHLLIYKKMSSTSSIALCCYTFHVSCYYFCSLTINDYLGFFIPVIIFLKFTITTFISSFAFGFSFFLSNVYPLVIFIEYSRVCE